jgi:uncharacterized membrane protein YhhN
MAPSFWLLPLLALLLAALNWIAVGRGWRTVEVITKPGVMLVLLVWLGSTAGFAPPPLWFALGVLFSLAADVILLLPPARWFVPGVVLFLIAHLCYIIGFLYTPPPLNPASLAVALLVALPAVQVYRRISASLQAQRQTGLRLPLLAYILVISLMLLLALLTLVGESWLTLAALAASAGALLFVSSDALLAWGRFVSPLKNGPVLVMASYHLGQFLLALAVILQYA